MRKSTDQTDTGLNWDAWHVVGHVWVAASHGCITDAHLGCRIGVNCGEEPVVAQLRGACPHTEFSYGGLVGEAVGRAHKQRPGGDLRDLDRATWHGHLTASAASRVSTSCVSVGDPYFLDPFHDQRAGVDLRQRMVSAERLASLAEACRLLAKGNATVIDVCEVLKVF